MAKFHYFPIILSIFLVFCNAQGPLQLEPFLSEPGSEPYFFGNFYKPSQPPPTEFEPIGPLYRLNNTFIPSNYALELLVLLDSDPQFGQELTAPGKITIRGVQSGEGSNEITLHSYLLDINTTSIKVCGFI
jgi:hypothetical protein